MGPISYARRRRSNFLLQSPAQARRYPTRGQSPEGRTRRTGTSGGSGRVKTALSWRLQIRSDKSLVPPSWVEAESSSLTSSPSQGTRLLRRQRGRRSEV